MISKDGSALMTCPCRTLGLSGIVPPTGASSAWGGGASCQVVNSHIFLVLSRIHTYARIPGTASRSLDPLIQALPFHPSWRQLSQFISLNVLFHQTPAPSQRPPPLSGSYRAKTLIAITFWTAASSVPAFLPEAWFPPTHNPHPSRPSGHWKEATFRVQCTHLQVLLMTAACLLFKALPPPVLCSSPDYSKDKDIIRC